MINFDVAKEIYRAINEKNEDRAKELINLIDNAEIDYNGKPLLIHAILMNQENIGCALLEKGASTNRTVTGELSPVCLALLKNQKKILNKIFEIGFDVNKSGQIGLTPLMIASMFSQLDRIKEMIKMGADINQRDSYGRTALMYAAMRRKTDAMEILLKNGGNPDLRDNYYKTASDYYKLWHSHLIEEQQELCSQSEGNNLSNNANIIEDKLIEWVKKGNLQKVKEIVENSTVEINYQQKNKFRGYNQFTPVMFAALFGRNDIIKYLVDKGADVNKCNDANYNPIKLAELTGKSSTVDLLLSLGADHEKLNKLKYIGKRDKEYEKLGPIEHLKGSVLLTEEGLAKEKADAFFKKLEEIKSPEILAILTFAAIRTIGSSERKPLKIVLNLEKGITDSTLCVINKTTNGKFDPESNYIYVSNLKNTDEALKVFIHELTHKVRHSLQDKNYEDLFYKTMESKNNFMDLKSKPSDLNLYWDSVLRRTELGFSYQNLEKILEENIADFSKLEMNRQLNSSQNRARSSAYEYVMNPIKNFFDKNMMPQIMSEIYNSPLRSKVVIPDELKPTIRQFGRKTVATPISRKIVINAKMEILI